MNREFIKEMQDRVEAWVSQAQHKVKYFPPFEIVAQLAEEVAELEVSTNQLSTGLIETKKEIGDVLFVLCCLSNSKELKPDMVTDSPKITNGSNSQEFICLQMYRAVGNIAREVSHLDGFKKKKPEEQTDGLVIHVGHMLYWLQILCGVYSFDIRECFDLTMEKKEVRDKNRFSK